MTALESGGAEKILYQTVLGSSPKFSHRVITLRNKGFYCNVLKSNNILVDKLSFRLLLILIFSSRNRTIIHSYLYHSHLFSIIFKILGFPVIWTIHSSVGHASFLVRLVGIFSHFIPSKIVYVSNCNKKQHVKIGYSSKKQIVIYNGINIAKYERIKKVNNMKWDRINICMISRCHTVKNYEKFASIAYFFIKKFTKVKFYLIGKGNDKKNKNLVTLLSNYRIASNVVLLGEVSDWHMISPRFNLLVSTSKMESFGLAMLEALLCGINVSTISLPIMNELLGSYTTNDGNIEDSKMAERWLVKSRIASSSQACGCIKRNYSLDRMLKSYESLYLEIVA